MNSIIILPTILSEVMIHSNESSSRPSDDMPCGYVQDYRIQSIHCSHSRRQAATKIYHHLGLSKHE